jgi:hypothetical protein
MCYQLGLLQFDETGSIKKIMILFSTVKDGA